MAVKGSIYRPMKVVPHRPVLRFLGYTAVVSAFVVGLPASYFLGSSMAQQQHDALNSSKVQQQEQAVAEVSQEITRLNTNAEVDRQTIESLRQSVMTQKAQLAAYERDLRVYKELLAPGAKTNALGVSFGLFTVFPLAEKGHFNYKLVVQKLATKDADFTGQLDFKINGQQDGKPAQILLHQVSTQVSAPSIPLNFKYFQAIEGDMQLPADFIPQNVELVVKSGEAKAPAIVETQLEWPASSS